MTDAALSLHDVHVGYGGATVLHGATITVGQGEVVALLGPNGAGKSTSLLTLSGLLKPERGAVSVLGRAVDPKRAYHPARMGLSHVPENRELIPTLSAQDNLRLGCAWSKREPYEVLSLFPALQTRLKRRAGLLSGGEQQMLALARGMISWPRALMIDELSLGLAPLIVQSLFPSVRRYVDETGAAALVVEQHYELALRIADRGYVLSHGEVVMEGTASELLRRRSEIERAYLSG